MSFAPRLPRSNLAKLLDVRAGDERTAAANQHGRMQVGVGFQFANGFSDALRHTRTERVDRRIIDGNDRDVSGLCELHQFAHDVLPLGSNSFTPFAPKPLPNQSPAAQSARDETSRHPARFPKPWRGDNKDANRSPT